MVVWFYYNYPSRCKIIERESTVRRVNQEWLKLMIWNLVTFPDRDIGFVYRSATMALSHSAVSASE